MSIVDLIIVGLTLAAAAWGYRRGVMTGTLVLLGFAVGAVLGLRVAPLVLDRGLRDPYAPVVAVPAALLCGALLGAAFERAGFELRRRLRGHGRLDAVGGALLVALLGLVAVWVVSALAARVNGLKDPVSDSAIVERLDAAVPPPGPLLSAKASDDVAVLPGPGEHGRPSNLHVKRDPQVRAAKASTARIKVKFCGRGKSGSGWIAADGIVVTNAHVVRGSDEIRLQLEGKGKHYPAEAIWYDDKNDVAILRAPGIRGKRPLPINAKAKPGTPSAMLGFPGGGPYVVKPARLGVASRIPGFRVEGDRRVVKRRVAIRMIARSRPGNSGGPVLDLEGRVVGMIFAHKTPGYNSYAVPVPPIQRALRRAGPRVGTGPCEKH